MDLSFIVIIIQLVFLEAILSIDNAAILGAMVNRLPDHEPVPWPAKLRGIGKRLNGVLGYQRTAALRAGLLGAYVGRGLMLFLASVVIQNPWIKLVGAIYLIRLALDDLGAPGMQGEEGEAERKVEKASFWLTVLNVELMDLVFSIDNVVAAVSLSNKLWVVLLGVAIGIVAMRFAAGIFSHLVEKEPILKQAAYVLILNIAIELLIEDFTHIVISDWLRFGISIATIAIALAYSRIRPLRWVLRPVLLWFSQGFGIISSLMSWLLVPFKGILILLLRIFHRPEKSMVL